MIPAVLAADDGSLSNFQKTRTYEDGQFTDVLSIHWFADSVKAAYEYGLVNGDSITAYNPDGNVTIAETLTLACRLNDIYYGGTGSFTQGAPWYQVYVDYAIAHGMITEGQYADYDAPATRAQFVTILAKALPQEALPAINSVALDTIPDVSASADYASDVYTFYNAGILMGNDTYGTFGPSSNILRSEVATIVVRLADESQRKTFALEVVSTEIPVESVTVTGDASTLTVGESISLIATVSPSDATDKTVTWTSSDTSVATVTEDGVVTCVKPGSAIITAASSNGKTSSQTITVIATANQTYGFLMALAMIKGTSSSDGSYSYTYDKETYDSTTYTYVITYYPAKQRISIDVMVSRSSGALLAGVYITDDYAQPYLASVYGKISGTTYFAKGYVYPATFTSSSTIALASYEGPASAKSSMATNLSYGTYIALKGLEDNILSKGGYSLKAFGFNSL
jgi:hypothetical protein